MPIQIHRNQRLLFSRSARGEILALHGSGDAMTRLLLKTPILHDLSPMTFPDQHGCYIWEGALVEESEPGTDALHATTYYWPGFLRQVSPSDLTDIFLSFGDQTTGQAILLAAYKASFGGSRLCTETTEEH
jgi:hypothetical protein